MRMVKAEFLLFFLTSVVYRSIQGGVVQTHFNFETDGVVELNQANFKTLVLNSNDKWVVDFDLSQPQCTPCVEASELIKKAVPLLKEKNIKVGYVEYLKPEGKQIADMYRVALFPMFYIFGSDKEYPVKLPFSPKTVEEFVSTVEFFIRAPPPADGPCGQNTVQTQESTTYVLTDENFEEVVQKCQDPWIINFYVPDVAICADFMSTFEAAAKGFKGRAKFGSFYLLGSKVAEKYGVTHVCTVKLFPKGNKDLPPVDFNKGLLGASISTNFTPWIKNVLAENLPAPEITELTSQSVLESKCTNSGLSGCLFFFLAKSDQCNADCKSTYLNLLKQISTDMKAESWAWLWTTQGNQPDFEQTFGITSFPGALAIDQLSKSYSVLRGTANDSRLKDFLKFFSSGRLPSKNLPPSGFPSVKNN